jgi:hypothetical protein
MYLVGKSKFQWPLKVKNLIKCKIILVENQLNQDVTIDVK